jgi:hypothetical protein
MRNFLLFKLYHSCTHQFLREPFYEVSIVQTNIGGRCLYIARIAGLHGLTREGSTGNPLVSSGRFSLAKNLKQTPWNQIVPVKTIKNIFPCITGIIIPEVPAWSA